jgi:hypothetical protein
MRLLLRGMMKNFLETNVYVILAGLGLFAYAVFQVVLVINAMGGFA